MTDYNRFTQIHEQREKLVKLLQFLETLQPEEFDIRKLSAEQETDERNNVYYIATPKPTRTTT